MNELRFTIPEILSLVGVIQCVYILVYMFMRAGNLSMARLPIAYFIVLGFAFLSDFATGYIGHATPYYFYLPWFFWFMGPPLSVLMALQIAQIHQKPPSRYYAILLLLPACVVAAQLANGPHEIACKFMKPCVSLQSWLVLFGVLAGALSLLGFWCKRDLFSLLASQKLGKDRYWLILTLFFINILFLATMLVGLNEHVDHNQVLLVRTVLGLAFIYLVSTSLFRVYPQAVRILSGPAVAPALSAEEREIAEKIKSLLAREKVYQEPSYSRTDLARECNVPENVITRVINIYFQKSYPQLINEYRIGDAKRLLCETNVEIQVVAAESGFNSVASFNRVFRELTGQSPGQYRKDRGA